MATTVQTIQNALEHRATCEATEQANALVSAIPYLSTLRVRHGGAYIEVDWHHIHDALKTAIIERLTHKRLDELTRELLESVNEIASLKEGLERHIQDDG